MSDRTCRPLRLLLLAVISPVALTAQATDPELHENDRIRVFQAGTQAPVVGRFVGFDGPVLLVGDRLEDATRIDLGQVDRLELRVPGRFGFWNGAGIAVGGTLLGGLVLQVFGGSEGDPNFAMAGALILAPAVGLLGGLIGSVIPRDSWEDVTVLGT